MFKVHEKLKKIRQFKGYNQAEIAKQLGTSVASYSRIEAGKTNLNIDFLKKICKVLDIELIDLLENNIQFLAEPKAGYEKRATLKEHQEKKTIETLIQENNLLLKTMLNLLEQQKETNNKLLAFLINRKK